MATTAPSASATQVARAAVIWVGIHSRTSSSEWISGGMAGTESRREATKTAAISSDSSRSPRRSATPDRAPASLTVPGWPTPGVEATGR